MSYLYRGSAVGMHNMVQVFMDTIEQPEEELLGIVLRISPVLHGTPCHSILHKCKPIMSIFFVGNTIQLLKGSMKKYMQC